MIWKETQIMVLFQFFHALTQIKLKMNRDFSINRNTTEIETELKPGILCACVAICKSQTPPMNYIDHLTILGPTNWNLPIHQEKSTNENPCDHASVAWMESVFWSVVFRSSMKQRLGPQDVGIPWHTLVFPADGAHAIMKPPPKETAYRRASSGLESR